MSYYITPTIEWCESVTHGFAVSKYINQFANTISNLAFIIFPCIQYVYNKQHKLYIPYEIHYCNITICIVGICSAWFHSQNTFISELADEFSMICLMAMYSYISTDLTNRICENIFHRHYTLIVSCLWMCFITTKQFIFFTNCILFQLMFPIYNIYLIESRDNKINNINKNKKHTVLNIFIIFIIAAKICWFYERYLYANNNCPIYSPLFYLHSLWHIFTAISHIAVIQYCIFAYNN